MAKPPKKIPRQASPQPPQASPDSVPSPHVETVHFDPDTTTANPLASSLSQVLPPTASQRSTVIISHAQNREALAQASVSRTAEWVRRHSIDTEPFAQAGTSRDESVSHPVFINPESANQLKLQAGTEEGLRYDKRKKAYVEMPGGFVMVSKTADGWRQTHAGEASPTGASVEQIPGTMLWREVETPQPRPQTPSPATVEVIAGPSRHAPLPDERSALADASTLASNLLSQQSSALDLSAGQWKNWGKAARPESGESIEIDGKHYSIVPQSIQPDTGLVYLQHPGFAPERFDAFENMLRNEPSRQPKWALKRDGQWRVLDNHPPFEMSVTQYVATAFSYLSAQSASNLARALFDRVALPQGVNAQGLSVMALTFRHWLDRESHQALLHPLSDPLVMLPVLPPPAGGLARGGLLTLPSADSSLLQRLDLDSTHFAQEWAAYAAAPTAGAMRELFKTVLQRNGYTINPTSRQLREGALIFHRPGVAAVFVLKLPPIVANQVPRTTAPGSEFRDPDFQSRLSAEQQQRLERDLSRTEIIYLIGGVQQLSADHSTLFIVREG
ncbi:hypothetical protein [Pseudomonas sp. AIG]|jgi:hypothetical protein